MNIIFIGMSTSGKSTIGEKLSKILNMQFIDEDEDFEKIHGHIYKLKEKSLEKFKLMRKKYLKEVLSKYSNTIISTGGGTGILKDLSFLKGKIFYLSIDDNTLIKRFNNITDNNDPKNKRRMLLTKDDNFKKKILKERHELYLNNANIIINGNQSIDNIINDILKKL